MACFLKKTAGLALITSLVAIAALLVPHLVMRKAASFTLSSQPRMVVFGHSHPECAFNDSLIDGFQNLAASGESPFYSLQKLRMVLRDNPNLEVVFIEFTNNLMSAKKDEWIWGDAKMNLFLPRSAPYMTMEDLAHLYGKNPKGFIASMSISARKNLYLMASLRVDRSNALGRYLRLKRAKVPEVIKENESQPKPVFDLDSYQESHLSSELVKDMVDYCLAEGRMVYLVRSPQHRYYSSRLNEELFQKERERLFKDVEFLDFNDFPLSEEEWGDFDHLNYKGAETFSRWFQSLLDEGLLSQENKQAFIASRMVSAERERDRRRQLKGGGDGLPDSLQ